MKKSKKIPKYPFGGLDNKDQANVENFFGNNLKAIGDIGLSTLGLDNVIKDSDYKGNSAKGFRQYSDIAGSLGKAILPTAANALLPGSGSFVKSGQQIAGNFNPEDNSLNQYDSNGNLIYQEQRNTKQIGNYYQERYKLPVTLTQYGVSLSDTLAKKNITELIQKDGCFAEVKLFKVQLTLEEKKGVLKDTIIGNFKRANVDLNKAIFAQKKIIINSENSLKKEKNKKTFWL